MVAASAVACSREEVDVDAGLDATAPVDATEPVDASDGGFVFSLDAFVWCEAGPPTFVDACGGCCWTNEIPCGISPDDIADDAGGLYHCDRYCKDDSGTVGCRNASDDGGALVTCGCTGRRFAGYRHARAAASVGGHFAEMARLEAAAVFAFERLQDELAGLGAPPRLVHRARRSIDEERRHARVVGRIARRFGVLPRAPRRPRFRRRSLERFAIENVVEGCVRETYGALLATWQAEHASDPATRRALRAIARDETRHAALSHAVAAFVEPKLAPDERARVARARRRALRDLRRAIRRAPSADLVRVAGLPTAEQASALVDALSYFFWT